MEKVPYLFFQAVLQLLVKLSKILPCILPEELRILGQHADIRVQQLHN
ncbi:hypothetical protein WwAna1578 [Wolbachia endosymbiont of Drosophila ananassae]|nr:hypothetical protein WwAna1578 [Wolbachia endosymbiont of Drosophila ananassae]